jgi:putative membrane protein
VASEPRWRQEGKDPDYRFTLANERTFLAWIRTALSLLAGGVLLVQFATKLTPRSMVQATAIALAALAGGVSAMAYRRWRANEIAMRHGRSLPGTALILLTAVAMAVLALGMALLMLND